MKKKFFMGPLSEVVLDMEPLTESMEGQLCGGFAGLSPSPVIPETDITNEHKCIVNVNCPPCPTSKAKQKSISLFI